MKKLMLVSMLLVAGLSYGASNGIDSTLQSIELKFNDLVQKEEIKRREFETEKVKLENEIVELKKNEAEKEEKLGKLRKDSEVRWYRDAYKKLLNEYEEYYKKLAKEIAEREAKVTELTQLLSTMQ